MMIIGSGGRPVHNLPSPALDFTLVTPPVLSRYQEKKVLQKMEPFLFYSYSSYLKVSHSLMIGGVLNTDENQRQDYYVTYIYMELQCSQEQSPPLGVYFSLVVLCTSVFPSTHFMALLSCHHPTPQHHSVKIRISQNMFILIAE